MKFLAVAAGLVAAVSAYTYPTPFDPTANGASPSGNAIYTPDTSSPVTLDEPYSITWDATTAGPVALVLCEGPSTNCVPMMTIAPSIANTGSYSWTPKGLTPSSSSSGGYGIMIIDWTTKAYQYSTQFGVLADPNASASSSVAAPTSTTTVKIVGSSSAVATPTPASGTVTVDVTSTSYLCPTSTKIPLGTGTVSIPWTTSTGSPSVPSTVASTAPTQPAYTGAAAHNVMSFGAVGAVAGVAALLAF